PVRRNRGADPADPVSRHRHGPARTLLLNNNRRKPMKLTQLLAATALVLASASLPAAAQTARIGYVPVEEHPVGQGVNKFAELVAEKTEGRIELQKFGNGTLGNEPQMQSSVQGGIMEIMVGPTSNLVGSIPEYLIFDLPFFYPDFEAVDKVMDGRVGDALFAKLDALDMV